MVPPKKRSASVVSAYAHSTDLPPYGRSLLPAVWKEDRAPSPLKTICVVLAVMGLVGLTRLSSLLQPLSGRWDTRWDQRHALDSGQSAVLALPHLVHHALHLPLERVHDLFRATGVLSLLAVLADLFLGSGTGVACPWPPDWGTANTRCYHEMFAEPTRRGRLLRRPGNALSNATYLLGSLCVLASLAQRADNPFWLADLEFGLMLLVLAACSFLWHSTNAPWTQYPDLWSMDSCILYLILRHLCLGEYAMLVRWTDMSAAAARTWAGGTCFLAFTAAIFALGRHQWGLFRRKYLHAGCPFSVRNRLSGTSDVFGRGHEDFTVATLAFFSLLPVFFLATPVLVQAWLLRSTGSRLAGDLVTGSLVVGWSYRGSERYALDGNPPLRRLLSWAPSPGRTVLAAVCSPTAVLHGCTGVTLLAGYVHARSLEEAVL